MTERTPIMHQEITPIPVRPWTLNGLSERLIVSHYENHYSAAVRTFNAVALGSVRLHELYFANLGGEGNRIPDEVRSMLEEHFGSVAAGGARAMQPASGKGGRS